MKAEIKSIVVSVMAFAVAGGIGCERKPVQPAKSSPPPAAAAPAKGNDTKGLAEFLNKDASKPDPTATGSGMNNPSGALPPGHPPLGAAAQSVAPPDDVTPLKYDAPAHWTSQTPSSAMRKAQFLLPRTAGDNEDGQLIVFQFGKGQGGAVEMNIQRWVGMFSSKDGQPLGQDVVKRETRDVGGMKVTTLDLSGRFADAMMGMPSAAAPKENYRMLAAIVETPDGPWFFKGVGPAATMESHLAAFMRMLDTVKR